MWQQLVGSQLDGKFRLVRLLGVGGFGAVFLAEEHVAGHLMRRIALKVIRSERNRLSEQVVELKSAVSLDHPCIVRCYSVGQCEVSLSGTTSDALYLVMELGSGNLLERVRSVQLSVDEAIDLSYEIASALHYLHARRLIHRDVKPGNIIRIGNRWKLSDFGLARYLGGQKTVREAPFGTLCYMSPESLGGEHSSAWDLWSLGVTLAEAMSGELPFDGDDRDKMIRAILEGSPRLPRELPFPLDRILNGCLARNRKSRINATQVLDLLEEAGVSSPQPRARTLEVSAEGGCEFLSITDGLRTAKRGDRILVKPGAYRECLVVDRSVELLGDGPEEEIVIDGDGGCCAFVQAGQAVFRGITFRSFPSHGTTVQAPAAIQIERGRSIVERCRVLSGLQAGISVRGATTAPIIRSCVFQAAKQAAIYVFERAKPIIADCAVAGSKRAGIWCADDGDPQVINCDIVQGVMRGVLVSESGRGTFQGCRIAGNGGVGIEIAKNGSPLVQRCVINDNGGAAFELSRGAKGVVHECQLKGNGGGVWVSHGANQVVRIDNCE